MSGIIVFGDSIMAGWNGKQQVFETVPRQIGEILGVPVTNKAVNGTQIAGGGQDLVHFVNSTSLKDYDLVMLGYGTNDWGAQSESLDNMEKGLDYFKQQLEAENPNAKVFYELPMEQFGNNSTSLDDKNSKGLSQNDIINFLKNYAISSGWGYYDWRPDPLIIYANRMQTTGDNGWGHPTDAIMTEMAKRLAAAIKPYLSNTSQPISPDNPTQSATPSDDSVLGKMNQYNYIYFGFDPKDESSSNQWAATPAMCGSNDGIHWKLIAEFPQLGSWRDGNIAKYGDYYWITGSGIARTKDFKTFERFDSSTIFGKKGYKDIWAPEFFTDLSGNWHMVWGAVSDSRHIYVADFNPDSGVITNAWQPVDEDHGMDPHIWTIGSKYYLLIDGYWLYQSDSYLGPFTIINNDMAHLKDDYPNHWYEAGETLIDGDTIFLYEDFINHEVSGVQDSGHMVVQTAKTNDLSHWSGEQRVIADINMRHGSFLNMKNLRKNSVTPTTPVDSITLQQVQDYTQISSVTKSNYTISVGGINAIYKKLKRLLGEGEFDSVQTTFTSTSSMLNRATWLFVVHVIEQIEQEINTAVRVFREEDLVNNKVGKPVEYLSLVPPTMLLLDQTYQNTLNDDWTAIQNKINEMLAIIAQFHF